MSVVDKILGRTEPSALSSLYPSSEDWEKWRAEVDQRVGEAGPQAKIDDIPAYTGRDWPCPKCGCRTLSTEYHRGAHERCPDGRMSDLFLPSFGLPDVDYAVTRQLKYARAIEHHDRTCVNCKYAFVEAALTPEAA